MNSFENKYSSSYDEIPVVIIKKAKKQLSKILVYLVQLVFCKRHFPSGIINFKNCSNIQKKDPLDIENY